MIWLALIPCARGEPEPDAASGEPIHDITELSLTDLLQAATSTATKSTTTAREAPAIVTVISGSEIRAGGYTSIAEVLRTVPGFYDLYDGVAHNIGVRGVNGGARAYGNVLQVRIDDQAVPLHTSTGNLFGPELIPLEAIERIEILRGPASAVYGANAFLGVVRIVTRAGASVGGVEAVGQGGFVRENPSGGGGFVFGGGDLTDVLVSVHGMYVDRTGLTLPATSPALGDDPSLSSASLDDLSRPFSVLAHATTGREDTIGRFTLSAAVQQLDAVGEFQDYAPLSHGTRIALRNQHYRLGWQADVDPVTVLAWVAAFDTRPTEKEQIDIDATDQLLIRNVAASGTEAGTEARVRVGPASITVGGEWVREHHLVQSYSTLLLEDVLADSGQVLRPAFTSTPGEGYGEQADLSTIAAYGQVEARAGSLLLLTAGTRVDRHNVYGLQVSPRAGVVLAPTEAPWSVKFLYGSSFKAPSAEQLYGYPIEDFDIRGNPDLQEQRAQTGEIAGTVELGQAGALLANAFVTAIDGRVEYLQQGLWLSAQNALSEVYVGGEVEATVGAEGFQARVGVGVARSVVQTRAEGVFAGEPFAAPFPDWQVHLMPSWTWAKVGLRVAPEASIIGPRPASQSNVLEAGEQYKLPLAVQTAFSVGFPRVYLFGQAPTGVVVRGTDLFESGPIDPGFGGIDYPRSGRTFWLTLTQGL